MKTSKTKHERVLLKKLEDLKGKVKYTHKAKHKGRRQSVAMVDIDKKEYKGVATLGNKERFNRKIGRVISLGRALKNFEFDSKGVC